MTISETSDRTQATADRVVVAAVWTFAILEAIGLAFVLWRY